MNLVETIKLVQRALDVDVDGDAGPQTWGAIAKRLGLTIPGTGMSTKLSELAEIAESQIGVEEDKARTNRGAAILKYQQSTNLDGQGWPWCAAFVDWCLQEFLSRHMEYARMGLKRAQTAAAFGLIDWGKQQRCHLFRGEHEAPQRGDIVVFSFSHCGIVTDVNAQGRDFHSVEGNTNTDGSREGYIVARKARTYGQVQQFIRLPELKEAA